MSVAGAIVPLNAADIRLAGSLLRTRGIPVTGALGGFP
jgi:hypothetical protein